MVKVIMSSAEVRLAMEHQMVAVCRYALIGPCLGGCVGLIQGAAAAAVWSQHGHPDFYFRGWEAVERGLILWGIAGAVLGVPFAAAVSAAEEKFGRRVQVVPALVSAVATGAVVAWALIEMEFARSELLPSFVLEGVGVAVTSLLVALWSRPSVGPVAVHDPAVGL